ncbi:MAG: hypothetical protein K2Z81_14460 [Cyanobacteria bacterium]|nr:hypothetical protein [Cyanobacteriota bacterium]
MDVIIEGQVTSDEGMDEVLRTCAEIKTVQTPILRINDNESDLGGRIAFSQGGYIIGAMISETGETGYDAVRKLLMISNGNYAILDPLRRHIADLNQSLWIKIERLVPLLPNLPENPDGLVDKSPEIVSGSLKSGQVDIQSKMRTTSEIDRPSTSSPTVDPHSAMRGKNVGFWRILRQGLFIIAGFALFLVVMMYQTQITQFFQEMLNGKH